MISTLITIVRRRKYAAKRCSFQGLPESIEFLAVANCADLFESVGYLIGPGKEFAWDGGFILNPLSGCNVGESESPGVEHEAGGFPGLASGLGVDGVAEEGVAEEAVVDADLVGASGVEGAEDEGGAIRGGVEEVDVGDGGFSGAWVADVHALAVDGVAGDVVEDGLVVLFGRRLGDGEVEFGGLAVGKLADE